jgi:DHA1 family tetracycline resistance protein-like MFS transporter
LGIPIGALQGLVSPSLQGVMTRRVGPTEQGQLQGAYGSLIGVASMIAPVLFTQVFHAALQKPWGAHVPGAPYLLAALFSVAALGLSWRSASAPSTEVEIAGGGIKMVVDDTTQ